MDVRTIVPDEDVVCTRIDWDDGRFIERMEHDNGTVKWTTTPRHVTSRRFDVIALSDGIGMSPSTHYRLVETARMVAPLQD